MNGCHLHNSRSVLIHQCRYSKDNLSPSENDMTVEFCLYYCYLSKVQADSIYIWLNRLIIIVHLHKSKCYISFFCYRHNTSCLFLFLLSCCGVKKHTKAVMGINYLPTTLVSGVQIAVKTGLQCNSTSFNNTQLQPIACSTWYLPVWHLTSTTGQGSRKKCLLWAERWLLWT